MRMIEKVKVTYSLVGEEKQTVLFDNMEDNIQRYKRGTLSHDTFTDILEKAVQYQLAKDEDTFINVDTLEFEIVKHISGRK